MQPVCNQKDQKEGENACLLNLRFLLRKMPALLTGTSGPGPMVLQKEGRGGEGGGTEGFLFAVFIL